MITKADRILLHTAVTLYPNTFVSVWDADIRDHVVFEELTTHDKLDARIDWVNVREGDVMDITPVNGECYVILTIGSPF